MFDDKDEELDVCHVVYFTAVRSPNWMEQFTKAVLNYATEVGRVLTHFDLCPKDDTIKCPALRYIKRNQERLVQAFGSEMYRGIDFYSLDPGKRFVWRSLYASLLTEDVLSLRSLGMGRGDEEVYGSVIIEYKLESPRKHISWVHLSEQFVRNIRSIVNVGYGIVTVMQNRKYPASYFRNSPSSPYLTSEERQEVEAWRAGGHRFQTVLRDVYWGNVLTRRHWRSDRTTEQYLLKALEHECHGNVFRIDEETLFFHAPFDICPVDDPRMLDFRKRLYGVLEACEIEVLSRSTICAQQYDGPAKAAPLIPDASPEVRKPTSTLRTKKKLIIRYPLTKNSEPTKEQKCVTDILVQMGPMPLTMRTERLQDGLVMEMTVDGVKVPRVRKEIIYCIKMLNMNIEVNPPIDDEDSVAT